jgi:AcrR family transcriptional regulator
MEALGFAKMKSKSHRDLPIRQQHRLTPTDRREQILVGAIKYFAEFGFGGGTRGLADRLGVTQPLIYRYFPSKEDLIRGVYERVFLDRWQSDWVALMIDRRRPLRARMIDFYEQYTEAVFAPECMRIFIFSGLSGFKIQRWWLSFIEEHILRTICSEIRIAYDFPTIQDQPITRKEIDYYWLFHGGVFYYGIRREIHNVKEQIALREYIEFSVDSLLRTYPEAIGADLLRTLRKAKAPARASKSPRGTNRVGTPRKPVRQD